MRSKKQRAKIKGPLLVTMKNTLMKRTILSLNADHTIPEANRLKKMRKHLPDELFKAAFSSKAMKRKVEEDDVPLDWPPKKRRSSNQRYRRWVS